MKLPDEIHDHAKRLANQKVITPAQYVAFAEAIVEAWQSNPELGEALAYELVGPWAHHDNIFEDEFCYLIGEYAAELELPDGFGEHGHEEAWKLLQEHLASGYK